MCCVTQKSRGAGRPCHLETLVGDVVPVVPDFLIVAIVRCPRHDHPRQSISIRYVSTPHAASSKGSHATSFMPFQPSSRLRRQTTSTQQTYPLLGAHCWACLLVYYSKIPGTYTLPFSCNCSSWKCACSKGLGQVHRYWKMEVRGTHCLLLLQMGSYKPSCTPHIARIQNIHVV